MPIKITAENFDTEILTSEKPVLLDFYADWCAPCRMLAPLLEDIAAERPDIKVCKVNVEEQGELALKFNVMSIPLLLAVKDGQITGRLEGYRPKAAILDLF